MSKMKLNLEEMLQMSNGKFKLTTVLLIADRMLEILDFIHSKNIIHVDLNTTNILISDSNQLFLSDFGLALSIVDEKGYHIKFRDGLDRFIGNIKFASLFCHYHMELSRRDDLVSLGYILFLSFDRSASMG